MWESRQHEGEQTTCGVDSGRAVSGRADGSAGLVAFFVSHM